MLHNAVRRGQNSRFSGTPFGASFRVPTILELKDFALYYGLRQDLTSGTSVNVRMGRHSGGICCSKR
jgi:hypothetical protein